MSEKDLLHNCIAGYFKQDLTVSQNSALDLLLDFIYSEERDSIFVLKGYAGTGKTTLIAAVVKALGRYGHQVILTAPTGRAAKVFSHYSGIPASTIHKKIYRQSGIEEGVEVFDLDYNKNSRTLYFVDEASMITESAYDSPFGSGSLLDDLLQFIHNGKKNRLILIGDDAQLPPVGSDCSPALNVDLLESRYGFHVISSTLTDIIRQAESSGILSNATVIRNLIGSGSSLSLHTAGYPDISRIGGGELIEELESCYSSYGIEECIVICRSNKRANRFNQGIRNSVLYMEEELCSGDRIMVVKNNYSYGEGKDDYNFIANGEMGTVIRTGKEMEIYGHRFLKAVIQTDDSEEETESWIIMDTLTSDSPALSPEANRTLFMEIEKDYTDIRSKEKRYKAIRENEFYGALQIKFSYAVTCHKSQGGQWDAVFIDLGYVTRDMLGDEYWRWLYTAFTRTKKKLYLINFPDMFFPEEDNR